MKIKKRNELIIERYKEGVFQEEIGRLYGLSQSAISKIIIEHQKGVISPKVETRGVKPKLNKAQHLELSKYLTEKQAIDYGFAANIWDKWSIKELISKEFKVDYHENYIYKLMEKIKFSSQKPIKKDYRQDVEKVAEFKNEKAEDIKKKPMKKKGS